MTEQTLIIAILVALVAALLTWALPCCAKKIHKPTKTAAAISSGCSFFCYSFMRQMRMACFSTLKRTSV